MSRVFPDPEEGLMRENANLRQRNAQLQGDLSALTAEAGRLRQIVDRMQDQTPALTPDPLNDGQ